MSTNRSAAIEPRFCHLRKKPDFEGYGFNLHAEKGMAGHYIGKVDEGSPAEIAGLKCGDRILEVNGYCVKWYRHVDVVARIKEHSMPMLLVVAPGPNDILPDLTPSEQKKQQQTTEVELDETHPLLPANGRSKPKKK